MTILPAFISDLAFIQQSDWLKIGISLRREGLMDPDADYLLPSCEGDPTAFRNVPMSYGEALATDRRVLRERLAPVWYKWRRIESSTPLFSEEVLGFFTEH